MSILSTKSVATATSLEGLENNFRSFIYVQSFINPENFVKVGPVDADLV